MLHLMVQQGVLQLERLPTDIAGEWFQIRMLHPHVVLQALQIQRRIVAQIALVPNHRMLNHVLPEAELVLEPLFALFTLHLVNFRLMRGQVVGKVALGGEPFCTDVTHVGQGFRFGVPRCCVFGKVLCRAVRFATFVANVSGSLHFRQVRLTVRYQGTTVAEAPRAKVTLEWSLLFRAMVLDVVLEDFRSGHRFAALGASGK